VKRRPKAWSAAEVRQLRSLAKAKLSATAIAKQLRRTRGAVAQKAPLGNPAEVAAGAVAHGKPTSELLHLPLFSHGRGHWFDPSTAHHSKSGTYVITRYSVEFRMAAGMADAKISAGGQRWTRTVRGPAPRVVPSARAVGRLANLSFCLSVSGHGPAEAALSRL
jgi:hypothetical protein